MPDEPTNDVPTPAENDLGLEPGAPPEQVAGATPPAPATAPTGVSKEEYDLLASRVAQMSDGIQQLTGAFGAMAQQRVEPPARQEPEVSEEQLTQMLESGEGAQILKAQRIIQAQTERRVSSAVQSLREEITQTAIPIVERQARADMPLYDELRKDIDEILTILPAAARTNVKLYEVAYGMAVHKNLPKILAREREAGRREAKAPAESLLPGGPAGRITPALPDGVPPFKEVFPEYAAQGIDADVYVQRMGYSNWADYYEKTKIEGE